MRFKGSVINHCGDLIVIIGEMGLIYNHLHKEHCAVFW
jgi:hypothetical protein